MTEYDKVIDFLCAKNASDPEWCAKLRDEFGTFDKLDHGDNDVFGHILTAMIDALPEVTLHGKEDRLHLFQDEADRTMHGHYLHFTGSDRHLESISLSQSEVLTAIRNHVNGDVRLRKVNAPSDPG